MKSNSRAETGRASEEGGVYESHMRVVREKKKG
jgi:hypothetical protein